MAIDKGSYVIVQAGDTLSEIVDKYVKTGEDLWSVRIPRIAKLNDIEDVNKIVVGQKIKLVADSSTTTTKKDTSYKVQIKAFGLVSKDSTRQVYVSWKFSHSNVDHYKVEWIYATGVGEGFVSSSTVSGTDYKQALYTAPEEATKVKVKITPVSKTYKQKTKNGKEVELSYWKGTRVVSDLYYFKNNPPQKMNTPSVTMDNLQMTATVENVEEGVDIVQFELHQGDAKNGFLRKGSQKITVDSTRSASWVKSVWSGSEYKVRCRSIKSVNDILGEWSDFSAAYATAPATPAGFTKCQAVDINDRTQISLAWAEIPTANSYTIEYSTDKSLLGASETTKVEVAGVEWTLDLDPGYEYFFRIKSKNDVGESEWSEISSAKVGTQPSAPTTWSSESTVTQGDKVTLYWIHNSENEDNPTNSILLVRADGDAPGITKTVYRKVQAPDSPSDVVIDQTNGVIVVKVLDEILETKPAEFEIVDGCITEDGRLVYLAYPDSETDQFAFCEETDHVNQITIPYNSLRDNETCEYTLDTSSFDSGTRLLWKVKTQGVSEAWSDWSAERLIKVYGKPRLAIELLTDKSGSHMEHTEYHLVESANMKNGDDQDIYVAYGDVLVDQPAESTLVANAITVDNKLVYSSVDNTNNVTIYYCEVNVSTLTSFPFYLHATETTDSSAENIPKPIGYHVSIISNDYYETTDEAGEIKMVQPGTVIYSKFIDEFSNEDDRSILVEFSAGNIDLENSVPYTVSCTVSMDSGLSDTQTCEFEVDWQDEVYTPNAVVTINEEDYSAMIKPFCNDVDGNLVNNVTLSVFRREYDGTFVCLAKNMSNVNNSHVVDPHPGLDYARYRIVAVDVNTGSMNYYDIPGVYIGGHELVVQWDEEWKTLETEYKVDEDSVEFNNEPSWSGSLLKLPYNLDISDSYNPDVELVEYIGRSHPVSYYGTQVGETRNVNFDIVKDDTETLYALRRLGRWMGDVYIREPSGSGYWANVTVSFNQNHMELVVPVTLKISRVEGGV